MQNIPNKAGFFGSLLTNTQQAESDPAKPGCLLNTQSCVATNSLSKSIAPEDWLYQIRTGMFWIEEINKARTAGKGSDEYDQIKSSLPAILWNFHFIGKRNNASITGSSGFMFFDIDSLFDINSIDTSKVYASWKSLSNIGQTIIIKTSGVTISNFKHNYKLFALELGIASRIDPKADKMIQPNIISYDPNIYINNSCQIHNAIDPTLNLEEPAVHVLSQGNNQGAVSYLLSSKTKTNTYKELVAPFTTVNEDTYFKQNNLDEFVDPCEVAVYENGVDVTISYIMNGVSEGGRKHYLLAICGNLVYLNPDKSQGSVYRRMQNINMKTCKPPLPEKEVQDVVNSIYKYKKKGTLKLIPTNFRKILFGHKSGYDKRDRQSRAAQEVAVWKRNKTRTLIYNAIEQSENKITIKSISETTGKSLRTVKNYWSEFKEYVKELNSANLINDKLTPGNLKPLKEARSFKGNDSQFNADNAVDGTIMGQEVANTPEEVVDDMILHIEYIAEEETEQSEYIIEDFTDYDWNAFCDKCDKHNIEQENYLKTSGYYEKFAVAV